MLCCAARDPPAPSRSVTDTEPQHEARAAAAHIAAADPVFGDVVKTSELVNPYIWPGVPLRDGDLLAGLVLHIISQQITTVVALSMFDKLNTWRWSR
jgi:hypothetical protein